MYRVQAFAIDGVAVSAEMLMKHTGTPHFQGYIEFTKKVGCRECCATLGGRAYCSQRRGSQLEATAYCCDPTKAGFLGGPWKHGEPSADVPGKRNDLDDFLEVARQQGLAAAARASPSTYVRNYRGAQAYLDIMYVPRWRPVRVFFLEGPPDTGKSSLVYDTFGYGHVYTVPSQCPLWFDGYRGQDVLFIDEYQGSIEREALLRLLDGHPWQVQVKGGFRHAEYTCVVLASNHPFALWREAGVRRRFIRGGYFRLSGRRGQYGGFADVLRGTAEFTDGLCGVVRRVLDFGNRGGVDGDVLTGIPLGAGYWMQPNTAKA